MFGNSPSSKKQSLLMRANGELDAGDERPDKDQNVIALNRQEDAVSEHRRARAARQSSQPNPLLSALGGTSGAVGSDADPHADAIDAIEREIDELVRQNSGHSSDQQQSGDHNSHERPIDDPRYASDEMFKPLIDPAIMFSSVWRWRWPILGCTLAGGILGSMVALGTPATYTAYSQLTFDPREIKLVERDLTPEFLGNQSSLAIVDSKLQTVVSSAVLTQVVERLNLDQNAEFNGSADTGLGLLDGISFIRSLFSNETPVDTTERVTIENLRNAVGATRTATTFVFEISARAQSPRVAADIANAVAEAFIEDQSNRQRDAAKVATGALDGQLDALKAAVESAERQAEDYAQANGLTRVDGQTLSDSQLVATAAQLTEAKAATIRARSRADSAQAASIDQVVSGGIPTELVTPGLTTFRAQFASLSQNAASLEQALGPKHPRLANAIAAREAARTEIAAELRRIVAGTQAELRSAVQNEQEIAAALARAKVDSGQSGEASIRLRELEAEIESARTLYKAALLRVGETNQLQNLATVNASILSPAEPPLFASSVSRKTVALGGALFGFLLGLGLATISGLRANFSSPNNSTGSLDGDRPHPTGPFRGAHARDRSEQSRHDQADPERQPKSTTSEPSMYPFAPFHPVSHQAQQSMVQPHHPVAPVPQQTIYAQSIYPYQAAPMAYGYPPQPFSHQPAYVHAYPMQPQQSAPQPMVQHPMQQPAQSAAVTADQTSSGEAELEALRASVQDIREVVDHLAQRRGTSRRFG